MQLAQHLYVQLSVIPAHLNILKEGINFTTRVLFSEVSLRAQLADCQAQVEHWQGVATICELSKQEELAELQKHCDQEIQSLQEALRGQQWWLLHCAKCRFQYANAPK